MESSEYQELSLHEILVILLTQNSYDKLQHAYQLSNRDLISLLEINRECSELKIFVHKRLRFKKHVLFRFFAFGLSDLEYLRFLSPNFMEIDFKYFEKVTKDDKRPLTALLKTVSDISITKNLSRILLRKVHLESLKNFPRCEEIKMEECGLRELDLPKSVKYLSMSNVTISMNRNQIFLENVESLKMDHVKLNNTFPESGVNRDTLFFFLSNAPKLKSLNLNGHLFVFGIHRKVLKKLTALESLSLFGGGLPTRSFEALPSLSSLKELNICCSLRENDIAKLENVRDLRLRNCEIENFPNLDKLCHLNIKSENLISFYPLRRLAWLNLRECTRLQEIGNLPWLQELTIDYCPLLSSITNLPKLKRLQIFGGLRGVTYQIKEIVGFPELQTIQISSSNMISKIEGCPKLKDLRIVKSCLFTLSDFPELEKIDVSGSINFTDVYNVPKLKDLYVNDTNFNKCSLVFNRDPEKLPLLKDALAFDSPSEPIAFLIRAIGHYERILRNLQSEKLDLEVFEEDPLDCYYEETDNGEQIFEKKIPELTVPAIKRLIEEVEELIRIDQTPNSPIEDHT